TGLVGDGLAFGGSSLFPAIFDSKTFDLSDAFQFGFSGHRFKVGGNVTATNYTYDYRFGSAGPVPVCGLDQFRRGRGVFYQAVGGDVAHFTASNLAIFMQDTWQAAPDLQLIAGFRYDATPLPKNKISFNQPWFTATGVRNDSIPSDYKGFSPRIGFVWD